MSCRVRIASVPLALLAAVGLAAVGCGSKVPAQPALPQRDLDASLFDPVPKLDAGAEVIVGWDGGGASCGAVTSTLPWLPKISDAIIAFDRSGSMAFAFGAGTRYSVERGVLDPLVTQYQNLIAWGYEEFPTKSMCLCCADEVAVKPALQDAAAVTAQIDDAFDPGESDGTPTAGALYKIGAFYATLKDGVTDRYVLLSTDGEPNCGLLPDTPGGTCTFGDGGAPVCLDPCDETVAQVAALAAAGVKTVVLGVSEDATQGQCLERLAVAGGAPRAGGPPSYYPATTPDALASTLGEIVGNLAAPVCYVRLAAAPPDPLRVAVFGDGTQIPWDPTMKDGWAYYGPGDDRIDFYGSWCSKITSFAVRDISVQFGCPPCGATAPCP